MASLNSKNLIINLILYHFELLNGQCMELCLCVLIHCLDFYVILVHYLLFIWLF